MKAAAAAFPNMPQIALKIVFYRSDVKTSCGQGSENVFDDGAHALVPFKPVAALNN